MAVEFFFNKQKRFLDAATACSMTVASINGRRKAERVIPRAVIVIPRVSRGIH